MTDRRIVVAEIGPDKWAAIVVSDEPAMVTSASGEDPVSAFAALVERLPWLATGVTDDVDA